MFRKPVIASNVGGPAERISHEVDGLLFQFGDPLALAETLARDLADGDLPVAVVASAGTVNTGAVDPLAEIADQCGFSDQAAFTRTFHRFVGVAPGQWRREHSK